MKAASKIQDQSAREDVRQRVKDEYNKYRNL
jgi:hypothetical protein